jgi:hypothetical protein
MEQLIPRKTEMQEKPDLVERKAPPCKMLKVKIIGGYQQNKEKGEYEFTSK